MPKPLGPDPNGDPLSAASLSSSHLGNWCLSSSEDSVTYLKSLGETLSQQGPTACWSYNASFSHCDPHFRRTAQQHPAGDLSLVQTSHPPLALGKGTEPPGDEIAANIMSLASKYHVSCTEPMEQDKRDSSPSSYLGRGVRKVSLSMLMSHNYLLTAKTNGRNGESDTKSKMSQVIDSCHLLLPQPRLARETQ